MEVTLPVTQLRTHIGSILKRLRQDPELVFKITHHQEVVAELRAPEKGGETASPPSVEQEIAAFIDHFLKGELPKKKGAYQRIRKLCAGAAEQLPYRTLEEAMAAVRGRGHAADRL